MFDKVNFNGQIVDADQPILRGSNRSFRYGDGLFESIRMLDGKIPFLNFHINRLYSGLTLLRINRPHYFSNEFFEYEIRKLTGGIRNARIRLTVFRKDGGLYLPESNYPEFLVEASATNSTSFLLNEKGLVVSQADAPFQPTLFSILKTNNALPYVLGKIEAEEKKVDDLILFNDKNRIVEATSSNIFLASKEKIVTPPISEGCLQGVMRSVILKYQEQLGIIVNETSIPVSSLYEAEEIWLTSATRGIQWVSTLDNKVNYNNSLAEKVVKKLNSLIKNDQI